VTGREPRRDETKRRILEVARDLFSQNGFDATTVRQIATHAGLTDAALYYHFKNKREILEAIWEAPVGANPTELRPSGRFTSADLERIVDTVLNFASANRDYLRLLHRETLTGDETARAIRQNNRAYLRRIFHQNLSTIYDADEADLRTEALVSLIVGSTLRQEIAIGDHRASESLHDPVFREEIQRGAARLAGLDGVAAR